MNKPIRTVSIFCLLLFLALVLNATYLQYYQADALNDRTAQPAGQPAATFSRERGAILVGRRRRSPRACESDDQYKFQRTYPQPFKYAPVTGWFSFGNETGVERARTPCSPATTRGCSSTAWSTWSTATPPRAATSCSPSTPPRRRRRSTGCEALGADVQGAVVAIEPTTGKILAMVSLPTFDPNKLASHDFKAANGLRHRLNADAVPAAAQPGRSRPRCRRARRSSSSPRPPRSRAATTTPTRMVPGGPTLPAPADHGDRSIDNEGRELRQPTKIPFSQAMECSCNTTFAQLAVEVGADGDARAGRGVRLQPALPRRPRPARPISLLPRRTWTRPQTAQSGIGQFDVTRHAAADGDGRGRDRQRRRRDEALHRRRGAVAAEPERRSTGPSPRSSARRSRPTTASELTKLMVATVQTTAPPTPAAIPGVEVAGKTGTAQSGRPTPTAARCRRTPGSSRFAPAATTRRWRSR